MPQDEHRILELEDQIRQPVKEFLIRMFERGFAVSEQKEAKNLNIASGMTRNGVKQELKLIDAWLSEAVNEPVGLLSACEQRLLIGQQLDVAEDIYLMGHQLAIQKLHNNGRCAIVRMEHDWIPVLTFEFGSDLWTGSDPFIAVRYVGAREGERHRDGGRFDVSDALASEIPSLMERPLAHFLGARLLDSAPLTMEAAAANVEVHNAQSGWQVIYAPAYLSERNDLGGPSTPVEGHVAAGTYRFGVARAGEVIWDPTHWNVPGSSPIFIPIP